MKKIIILIVVIIVVGIIYIIATSGAPKDVEQGVVRDIQEGIEDTNNSNDSSAEITNNIISNDEDSGIIAKLNSFTFEGFAPGKSHVGTFESFTTKNVSIENGIIIGGQIVFDAASLKTDNETLDKHLCTDDFFDCEKYPEIIFTLKNVSEKDSSTGTVTGIIDFHGVQKELSFDITKTSDEEYSADFLLDTTPFAFKYIGIDKDVRIKFSGTVK